MVFASNEFPKTTVAWLIFVPLTAGSNRDSGAATAKLSGIRSLAVIRMTLRRRSGYWTTTPLNDLEGPLAATQHVYNLFSKPYLEIQAAPSLREAHQLR